MSLSSKHHRTLDAVFDVPARADVPWADVERLFAALGAEVTEGNGSHVRVVLGNTRAVFHRPHPKRETDKGALASVRRFLRESGFEPE